MCAPQVQSGVSGVGETSEELRLRFGTTAANLVFLNVPLYTLGLTGAASATAVVPAGTLVCVVPNSCDTVA